PKAIIRINHTKSPALDDNKNNVTLKKAIVITINLFPNMLLLFGFR
ncbi:unnamed protein product, partial [marine sediment metagenome]